MAPLGSEEPRVLLITATIPISRTIIFLRWRLMRNCGTKMQKTYGRPIDWIFQISMRKRYNNTTVLCAIFQLINSYFSCRLAPRNGARSTSIVEGS